MKHTLLLTLIALSCICTWAQSLNDPDVTFYGYVGYADSWMGDSGNYPKCGIYSFSRDTGQFTQHTNDEWDMLGRNSGLLVRNKFYLFCTAESWIFPDPRFFTYNTATWKQDHSTAYGRSEKYATADFTFDYATEELLAIAFESKSNYEKYSHLYSISTSTGTITDLATTKAVLVALASDADGHFYTISKQGDLYKMDRSGTLTKIGATGLVPQEEDEVNSLAYDYRTGRLYWAASAYKGRSKSELYRGLFELDTVTGKATQILVFNDYQKVTALSIPCPYYLEAPDNILDLQIQPTEAGSHNTLVRFTAPAVSFRQTQLAEGALTVRLWVDGIQQEDLTVEAGAQFECPVAFTNDGTHSVQAQLIDSEGRESLIASADRYIGFDTPVAVSNVKMDYSADRQQITLTWEPATEGINQGDLDLTNLHYLITRYSPGEKEDVAVELTTNTYSESVDRPMAYTRYGVTAYTDAKESKPSYSNYSNVGLPVALPFICGLNSWGDFNRFIVIDANNDGYNDWGTPAFYYDEAYGAAFCYLSYEGQDDWLVTPALALEAGKTYQMIFQAYGYYGYESHLVVAAGERAEADALNRTLYDTTYAIKMPEVFPYNTEDVLTVSVVFKAEASDRYLGIHNLNEVVGGNYYTDHMSIDNIYIREVEEGYGEGIGTVIKADGTASGRAIYDIQGKAVKPNAQSRGIYLENGRKVLRPSTM